MARCRPGADVLLLNPDARIDSASVHALQARLGPRVAAVAPRLRRPSGQEERTTWPLPRPLSPWWGIFGLTDRVARNRTFVSGAVLLLNHEAIADVGVFDDRFFLYAEETDWQNRAARNGWSVLEEADLEAVHVGAGTSTDARLREQMFHSSAELYIRKWYGPRGWWVFRLGSLLSATRRWASATSPTERRRAALTLRLYLQGPARCARQARGR